MALAYFAGVDASDRVAFRRLAHRRRELRSGKVPELDGELAAKVPQHANADPGGGEVALAAAHDDAAPVILAGGPGRRLRYETIGDSARVTRRELYFFMHGFIDAARWITGSGALP